MTSIDKMFKKEGFYKDEDEYEYGVKYIRHAGGLDDEIIDFREWGDEFSFNYRVVVTNFGVDKELAKIIVLKMEEMGW